MPVALIKSLNQALNRSFDRAVCEPVDPESDTVL